MKIYPIPASFIVKEIDVSWIDVVYGISKKYANFTLAIAYANKVVSLGNYSDLEFRVSCVDVNDSDEVDQLINEICGFEFLSDEVAQKEKWLFIVLYWLWINRFSFDKPLDVVEFIYSDFDYPEEIESFVSYMPPKDDYDPSIYSYEENLNHMMNKWKGYIDRGLNLYAVKSSR